MRPPRGWGWIVLAAIAAGLLLWYGYTTERPPAEPAGARQVPPKSGANEAHVDTRERPTRDRSTRP